MCRPHWFTLPKPMRDEIWRTYQSGQEKGLAPVTRDYLHAAHAAIAWLAQHEGKMVHCSCCNKVLNAHESLDRQDLKPEQGAATICMHCGTILIFDDEIKVHEASATELANIRPHDRSILLTVQHHVRSRS